MKKVIFFFLALLSVAAQAQNQSSPPGTISRSRSDDSTTTNAASSTGQTTNSSDSSTAANQSAAASLTFTNAQGQSYTVAQLAEQLKTLRATVEQAMPMISAFNETYSNSPSGDKTLTGRISGLLSGAINRNQTNSSASDQSSAKYGNLVTALENALSKNKSSSAPISANTIRDLETLQTQLQPVNTTLKGLNVDIGSSSSGSSANSPALTPTGKNTPNRPNQ